MAKVVLLTVIGIAAAFLLGCAFAAAMATPIGQVVVAVLAAFTLLNVVFEGGRMVAH